MHKLLYMDENIKIVRYSQGEHRYKCIDVKTISTSIFEYVRIDVLLYFFHITHLRQLIYVLWQFFISYILNERKTTRFITFDYLFSIPFTVIYIANVDPTLI